jgi:outer membrane protein assembly factor BamB
VVYFGGDDGVMYAVDAQNGAKHWTFATGGNIYGAPVVNNGVVYFGSSDGNFFALRAADGKFRLHFPTDAISSSPVVFGDNVYFTSDSGSLFGIYGLAHNWVLEDNIRPVWSRLSLAHLAFAPPQYSGLLLSAKLGKYSNSSPSIVGNSLFVGADNALIAYDIQNQRILWSHVTANRINSSPAVAGNVVYFGSDDKRIYAVNAADGSTIWQIATGDKVQSSPALANGMLYVGSLDCKLYAIK